MNCQMMRVISSPSSSTTVPCTLILAMRCVLQTGVVLTSRYSGRNMPSPSGRPRPSLQGMTESRTPTRRRHDRGRVSRRMGRPRPLTGDLLRHRRTRRPAARDVTRLVPDPLRPAPPHPGRARGAPQPVDVNDRITVAAMQEQLGVEEELRAAGVEESDLKNIASPLQILRDTFDLTPSATVSTGRRWPSGSRRCPARSMAYIASLHLAAQRGSVRPIAAGSRRHRAEPRQRRRGRVLPDLRPRRQDRGRH